MKRTITRAISVLIAALMVFSMIPTMIFATGPEMDISASKVSGCPGETVTVTIDLSNNPGIASLKFNVGFNEEYLTLESVSFGEGFGAYVTAPEPYQNPQTISFVSPLTAVMTNGLFASLVFKVSPDAPDGSSSDITITYDEDDVFNSSYDNVKLNITNGKVNIITGVPGDIDGNKAVNNKDAILLFRYVAGWDVTVDPRALDVTGDGKINNKDAITLFRYVAGWKPPAIELPLHWGLICQHNLLEVEAVAPTCLTDGHDHYWRCTLCGKCFSDANGTTEIRVADTVFPATGHSFAAEWTFDQTYHWHAATCEHTNVVSDKAEHTFGSNNLCVVCGAANASNPAKPYAINYKLFEYNENKGDAYIGTQYIDNSANPSSFGPADSFELQDVVCPGYEFLGWFTAGGARVTEVSAGTTHDLTLYARWSENVYTITYNLYQTPVTSAPTDEQKSYTVNRGNYNLYNPVINNYIFLGWYDENGVEYKTIPIGTTGHVVLNAYYTSLRNLAVSKTDNNPFIVEDWNNNVVYFTYEIGEIRHIPLTPDKPFWEIQSVAGLSQQESISYTRTISEEEANGVSKIISDMTVSSNTWTLAETWNDVTTVNDIWAQSIGKTAEQCLTESTTSSNTISVSDQTGGSSYHKTEDGTTVYDYDSKTETNDKGHQFDASLTGTYSNKLSANLGATNEYGTEASYNASNAYTSQGQNTTSNWSSGGSSSASDKDKYSAGVSYENGYEISAGLHYGYHNNTNTVTKTGSDSVTVNSNIDENTGSWNSAQSFSATNQHSTSQSIRNTLSDVVTTTKEYGTSYSHGGTDSTTQGFSSTSSNTAGTTSTVTYSKLESETKTTTYSVDGRIEGKYRCILVGTAHVFAVVGYDYNTKSYFTYTFTVMDDKTEEFLDYTPKGGNFTDCENSCLPFEIPNDIFDYVNERTVKTKGILYRPNSSDGTATITGYEGSSSDVVIPSYVSDGKQAYKVTGISSTAFAGKNIRAVVLGEHIKSIPAGAFKNCTSLEAVIGSFSEIGDEAFSGCTNLTNMNLPSNVVRIGTDAFKGVNSISVRAINSLSAYAEAVEALPNGTDAEIASKQQEMTQEYINSVLQCGAQNIVLDLSMIAGDTQLTLEVPQIASIEINGGSKTFNDFVLKSAASSTELNEIRIRNTKAVPLTIDSSKLSLHKVFVSGNATALILKKDGAKLTLNQDSRLESAAQYTVVSKNPVVNAAVSTDGAAGYLTVAGDFGFVNSIQGNENVDFTRGKFVPMSDEEFENYIKGAFTITFDGNGGTPSLSDITIYAGNPIGELPTATRDYYSLDGWYKETGEKVTPDDVFYTDTTLYAHWTINPVVGWTVPDYVPADAEIVNTKWTYTQTTTTESTETSMSGYSQIGSRWVQSGSGSKNYASFPSGFSTSHWIYTSFGSSPYDSWETTTSKRTVSNSWAGYVFWHWMYDCGGAGGGYRAIYDRYGYGPTNNYLYKYFGAFTSTNGYTYYGTGSYCNNLNMAVYWDTPYSSNADCQGTWFWFRFDYYTSSYTDYYKMFKYQKVEDLESNSEVTAGTTGNITISNVNRWVMWRPKTMELSVTAAGSTTYNGHTYTLYTSTSPIAWEMAKFWCENNNGYLACVTSAGENAVISNLANGKFAWLGGYRVNGGDWAWVNGEAFSYSDWRNGEPNNTYFTEWYLHYHADGAWNDIPAVNTSVYAFIIETD